MSDRALTEIDGNDPSLSSMSRWRQRGYLEHLIAFFMKGSIEAIYD